MISHSRKSDFLFWSISWRKRMLCCKVKIKEIVINKVEFPQNYKADHEKDSVYTSTNLSLKSRLANLCVNSNSSLRYSHIWAYFASFQAISDLHFPPKNMSEPVRITHKTSHQRRHRFFHLTYLSKRPSFRITSARLELAFPTNWNSFFLSIVNVPVFSIPRFMSVNSATIPST